MGELTVRPDIEHVILVSHPRYQGEAEFCQDALKGWVETQIVQTEQGGWEAYAETLEPIINGQKGVAVGVVAGDGTFQDIGGAFVRTPSLAETTYLTSMKRGGNACDIGRAQHSRGAPDPRKPFSTKAHAVDAFALECQLEIPDEDPEAHLAISYLGFGESAHASGRVLEPWYQRCKWNAVRDTKILLGTFLSKHAFAIGDEIASGIMLRSLEFNKGSAIAKHGRVPVHHWEQQYRINPVTASHAATIRTAAGLLVWAGGGFNTEQPYTFTLHSPTPVHFDGDPRPGDLPPGTQVHVGLAEQSYKMLASRWSARRAV